MNEENQISYYAIIPATVRYDSRLKPAEKLIYGEITSLTNKMGYCFAKNKYFADLYNVTNHTVSQWISHLEKLGYVYIELIRTDKKEIQERRIYIRDSPYVQKNTYPYVYKSTYPMYKNVQDNNINNKIDRVFNYIIRKSEIFPKELEELDLDEVYNTLNRFELLYTEEMISSFRENSITKVKFIIYALVDLLKSERRLSISRLSRNKLIGIYDKCKDKENDIVKFYDYFLACIINEIEKP